jgi:formamidopyrimidine-DNA glycosylase
VPELPEVETVRTQINEILPFKIKGAVKSDVLGSILKEEQFSLENKTIESIERIGKMLIFKVGEGEEFFSHLGMTGAWLIGKERPLKKHTHLILEGEKYFLSYFDPRRFGKMYIINKKRGEFYRGRLGVDLASKEFTLDYFNSAVKKYPERKIKVHLLDQKFFAGSGNYIANEICAHAGVRPTRKNKTLTLKELEALYRGSQIVLEASLKGGGVTFQGGYQDTTGSKGEGVQNLVVFYQEICRLCHKTPVKKIILSQRWTYYCPRCQK